MIFLACILVSSPLCHASGPTSFGLHFCPTGPVVQQSRKWQVGTNHPILFCWLPAIRCCAFHEKRFGVLVPIVFEHPEVFILPFSETKEAVPVKILNAPALIYVPQCA